MTHGTAQQIGQKFDKGTAIMSAQPLQPIVSRIAIFGHPLHPALIHIPVAALIAVLATDITYLVTGDYFWARASLWLVGVGTATGAVSGTAGVLDLALVPQIRRLITAWCHGILAVMLMSLAALNWLLRYEGGADTAILPWGIYLSGISAALVVATGSRGAQLVFEHAVGVDVEDAADKRPDI